MKSYLITRILVLVLFGGGATVGGLLSDRTADVVAGASESFDALVESASDVLNPFHLHEHLTALASGAGTGMRR